MRRIGPTDLVEQFTAGCVLEKEIIVGILLFVAVESNDVLMAEQLVQIDLKTSDAGRRDEHERVYFFSNDHIVALQSVDVNDFDRGEFIGSDILGKNNSRRQRTRDAHTDGMLRTRRRRLRRVFL